MSRWALLLLPGLALGAALSGQACGEDGKPGAKYNCSCQVTCDGETSRWDSSICYVFSEHSSVNQVAKLDCEMANTLECDEVACDCANCAFSGDPDPC